MKLRSILSRQTTRRQFLRSGLAGATALTMSPAAVFAATTAHPIPIGCQLYAVRGELARDLPATLRTLDQIGYQGVEFWDYAGTADVYRDYSATDLRRILDECHLTCCGMHVKKEALAQGALPRTLETSRMLDNSYLNLVMAPENMKSETGIAELAGLLNRVSAECQAHKLAVGYHCHGFDFARINGRFAWELLFRRLRPEVNMQLDIGNCLGGGGDPMAMLKQFPGRSWTVHLKEYADKTFDSDYYREIFELCETRCATRWYIVEMGDADGMGFVTARAALARLRRLGK